MKKIVPLFALVLTIGALIGFYGPKNVAASLTGYLYGHGLFIESVPGTVVAFITNAGAAEFTSVSAASFVASGPSRLYSASSTTLAGLAPAAAGAVVYNSSYATVCVSTGTGVGAWVLLRSTATDATFVACD